MANWSVLRVTERARAVLSGDERVELARPRASAATARGPSAVLDDGLPDEAAPARKPRRSRASAEAPALDDVDQQLFAALRALRKRLADERGVPAYVIFTDATLAGMCRARPSTEEALLEVSGVGQHKLARFGAAFLAEIAAFGGGPPAE